MSPKQGDRLQEVDGAAESIQERAAPNPRVPRSLVITSRQLTIDKTARSLTVPGHKEPLND